jgi:hypothetical protein
MRTSLLVLPLLVASLSAQVGSLRVVDVGLTMVPGSPTSPVNFAGQVCGPFSCTPFPGDVLSPSSSLVRTVRVHGEPNSLFVLFLSIGPLAQPCQVFPGIGNALIVGVPATTLAFGVTGPLQPSTSAACRQGVGTYQLTVPNVAPAAIVFRLQALAMSFSTQAPAFTVAIEATAR